MNRNLLQVIVISSLLWMIAAPTADARDPRVMVNQLLQTTQSWDGNKYTHYVTGQPQITILRISIPPNTALNWHEHPMISAAYVVSGQLNVEIRGTRKLKTVHAGQTLAESVATVHRGYTTNQPVELIVFYAGAVGLPLSINANPQLTR
jgi:quercetin dioxygenase-like cupin family protein